jgi:hypothetical protein
MSKTASDDGDAPDVEPRPVPDERPQTLELVATRRVFATSRELMVARDPESPRGNRDGIAFTCDVCGHGAKVKKDHPVAASDALCDCTQTWAACPNDDCEQVSWAFVNYTDCRIHGRTRPDDLWTTLSTRKEGEFS